ncbi:MAG TPA: PAS domain S-box protein [Planctomycetes bacterium]|nr:PAS domain S-box protein [Fuerstiella sp.]HIK96159.1 PAS domain S-box protein [Planctomycetota bacterium]
MQRLTVTDITDHKRAEEQLQLREQQLRLIYDSTADVLFHLKVEPGPNYRFLTVNAAFLQSTGLTEDQIIGKTISEVIPVASLKLVESKYKESIQKKKVISWEEASHYPTGLRTGVVSIAPVTDAEGNCTHLVGSVHDITVRKRAEETIDALVSVMSETTGNEFIECVTKLLTESLGMAYAHVSELLEDNQQKLHTVVCHRGGDPIGGTLYSMTGGPCERLIGKTFQIYSGRLWEEFQGNEFLRTSHFQFYAGATIFSSAGKPLGVLCAMAEHAFSDSLDIETLFTLLATRCGAEIERHKALETLRHHRATFAHASRVASIEGLSSGIVHEISQPLFQVSNFSGACRRTLKGKEFEGSTEVKDYIDRITQVAATAQETVSRLRGFLKRQEIRQIAVAIGPTIKDVLRLLAFEIRKHCVTIDCDITLKVTAFADPVQLQQILVNFILNSCEALDAQSAGNRRIQIRAAIVENMVEIAVEDNGSGVSKEAQDHLFQPFFTTKATGMGIGMSITKEIVSQHNGNIWFTSPHTMGPSSTLRYLFFRTSRPWTSRLSLSSTTM